MTDEHRRPLLLDEGELESEDEAAGLGGRYGGAVLVSDPLGALNNVQPAPQRPFVELPPAYTASKCTSSSYLDSHLACQLCGVQPTGAPHLPSTNGLRASSFSA